MRVLIIEGELLFGAKIRDISCRDCWQDPMFVTQLLAQSYAAPPYERGPHIAQSGNSAIWSTLLDHYFGRFHDDLNEVAFLQA